MRKQTILEFLNTRSSVHNSKYNKVADDVKTRIIDKIDSYEDDDLTLHDINCIEADLDQDTWINYDEIFDYYAKNKWDIEDLVYAYAIGHSLTPNSTVFDFIKYAVLSAHKNIIQTIMNEIRGLF